MLALLGLALGLRVYGLAWGYPATLHCDEAATLGNAAGLARSLAETGLPFAPRSSYGNLPYFLLLLVVTPLGALLRLLGSSLADSGLYLLTGRALSALADTGTVYLVYVLGRRLWGGRAGLLGAALYAVTLLAVREAHFATVDSLTVFTTMLLVLLSVRAADRPGWRSFLWCGVGLGLALSVRISAVTLAVVPLLVWAVWAARQAPGRTTRRPWGVPVVGALVVALAAAGLGLSGKLRDRLAEMAEAHLARHSSELLATGHSLGFWRAQAEAVVAGSVGLAMSLMVLVGVLGLATVAYALSSAGRTQVPALSRRLGQPLALLGLGVGLFVLLNPASVFEARRYWLPGSRDSILSTLLLVAGANRDVPPAFTFQFVGTTPGLYQLQHVYPYALGLPLLGLALAAVVYWTVRVGARRAGPVWIPVTALLLLLYSGSGGWIKMARYVLPQLPLLCLLAGGLLAVMLQARGRGVRALGAALGAAAGVSGLLWCVAYLSIYAQPDSRLQALEWVKQHARPGEHILIEEDDAWGAAGLALWENLREYEVRIYDPHLLEHDYYGRELPPEVAQAKEQYLAEHFTWAHYVVLTGLRRERMERVARWFPVMFPYYALLFTGQAGLVPAAAFTPEPRLGRWTLSDRGAEPTFRLFDHPDVYVFRRE